MGATLSRHLSASQRVGRLVVADYDGKRATEVAAALAGDANYEVVGVRVDVLDSPGMDQVTSIPAALAVDQLLAHPAPPGVHPPETVIAADALLEAFLPHCPGVPASVDEIAPITEARA